MLTQHAQQAPGYGINRRDVLRGLAAVSLVVACPTAAAAVEPLPAAWVAATGTPFPQDDDAIREACRRFPQLARARFSEVAARDYTRRTPEGMFVFTVSVRGLTVAEVEEVAAAEAVRIIEQEGARAFLWDGRLRVLSIPAGSRYPVAIRMQALHELVTAATREGAAHV